MGTAESYSVKLTADELLLLDGKCSADVQASVELAKSSRAMSAAFSGNAHGEALSRFVAEAVAEAKKNGQLTYRNVSLHNCKICGKYGGYAKYQRGRNRGMLNYDRPLSFAGRDLAVSRIIMRGHADVGGCIECVDAALPTLKKVLVGVEAALAAELVEAGSLKWQRFENRQCTKCGWEGHEGQMGRRPTLFGDGTYAADCPECKASNAPFAPTIVGRRDGFTIVPA